MLDRTVNIISTRPLLIADTLQRPLRDLRISVTDRCNLRCTYCMPREVFGKDFVFLPRAEILTFEEIERVAALFVQLGVQKIRLTGGEPLMRHGVEHLIEALARLTSGDGRPVEIALTTNGLMLSRKAQALKDAGLSRLTVSLDGLSEEIFQRMSDSTASVMTVLDGIAAAQALGFSPIKVNMVIKREVNDKEIIPMVRHFRDSGLSCVLLSTWMSVPPTAGAWTMWSRQEILERISSHYPLRQLDPNYQGKWPNAGRSWMAVVKSV